MATLTTAPRTPARLAPAPTGGPVPGGHLFGHTARAALAGLAISLLIVAPGFRAMYAERAARREALAEHQARLASHANLVAAPARPVLPVAEAAHGRSLFTTSCAACHKADGTGMPGLGKDLTASWFIASLDDAALRRFIAEGRPETDPFNTTRVPMPPSGGHPELTESDLADIVTFVRGLQDPRRMPDLPAEVVAAAPAPSADAKAQALAAAGGDEDLAEYIAHGNVLFASTCAACHGKDGKGLPKLGKDLVNSDLSRKLDDDALLAFVKKGRDPSDPANTSGVGMPPKGGNPALSDDDILDVIAYVRSLQQQG